MSAPVVGGHVWVRESKLATVRQFYPGADKDVGYLVTGVDRSKLIGRPRVYIADPRDQSVLCLWLSHVRAFPRCEYCSQEGHTKETATQKNCEELARQAANENS